MIGKKLAVGFVVIIALCSLESHAATYYHVTDLGFLGQRGSGPNINATGTIIGNDSAGEGVYWENGVLSYLPTLSGTIRNVPTGMNDNGEIVGYTQGSPGVSLIWKSGTVTEFLTEQYANPLGISNDGTVIGWYRNDMGNTEAFISENGEFFGLSTFGGTYSMAVAVNNIGQAIGQMPSLNQWFFWDDGTAVSTEGLGHGVQDINDAGLVVGQTSIESVTAQAFVWSDGDSTLLGTLRPDDSTEFSAAWAINNPGVIVGESYGPGRRSAVVWVDAHIYNLNSLLLDSGWHLEKATDLNENGYIVGEGINPYGQRTSFLLSPTNDPPPPAVPEPSSLAMFTGLLGMGLVGFGWRRRRNR